MGGSTTACTSESSGIGRRLTLCARGRSSSSSASQRALVRANPSTSSTFRADITVARSTRCSLQLTQSRPRGDCWPSYAHRAEGASGKGKRRENTRVVRAARMTSVASSTVSGRGPPRRHREPSERARGRRGGARDSPALRAPDKAARRQPARGGVTSRRSRRRTGSPPPRSKAF
ncbi:hypothetical protein BV20DRAFT_751543 [Pilatotrama ljubarskyi]|nr:hypothetical protein BV20DRAFT_751543 [Pilatotrama ljubarskyi]